MKKMAAIMLAGVLAAGSFSTVSAAEFSDGAGAQSNAYFADNFEYSWSAGEDESTDTDEKQSISANDSVVEGLDKPLTFLSQYLLQIQCNRCRNAEYKSCGGRYQVDTGILEPVHQTTGE